VVPEAGRRQLDAGAALDVSRQEGGDDRGACRDTGDEVGDARLQGGGVDGERLLQEVEVEGEGGGAALDDDVVRNPGLPHQLEDDDRVEPSLEPVRGQIAFGPESPAQRFGERLEAPAPDERSVPSMSKRRAG